MIRFISGSNSIGQYIACCRRPARNFLSVNSMEGILSILIPLFPSVCRNSSHLFEKTNNVLESNSNHAETGNSLPEKRGVAILKLGRSVFVVGYVKIFPVTALEHFQCC